MGKHRLVCVKSGHYDVEEVLASVNDFGLVCPSEQDDSFECRLDNDSIVGYCFLDFVLVNVVCSACPEDFISGGVAESVCSLFHKLCDYVFFCDFLLGLKSLAKWGSK